MKIRIKKILIKGVVNSLKLLVYSIALFDNMWIYWIVVFYRRFARIENDREKRGA